IILLVAQQLRLSRLTPLFHGLREVSPDAILAVDIIERMILFELRSSLRVPLAVEECDSPPPMRFAEHRVQLDHLVVIGDSLCKLSEKEQCIPSTGIKLHTLRVLC